MIYFASARDHARLSLGGCGVRPAQRLPVGAVAAAIIHVRV